MPAIGAPAPSRAELDGTPGGVLVEFGSLGCGHCRAARPLIDMALGANPGVRHVKVEDGPGQALGRSFGVRLWPTLVALRDGTEVARLVRPADVAAVEVALAQIGRPT